MLPAGSISPSTQPRPGCASRLPIKYHTLPKERVYDEFMKWAIQSSRPGRILEYL